MEKELLIKSEQLGKKRNNRKTWKTIVSVLASIVVFCTTYALILPAITMEAKTYCGKVEHEHGDECYETKLICTLSDKTVSVEHKHTDECYEEKAHLICEQKESEGHTHSDACKKIETLLDCGQEESEEHTHSEECYKENVSYVCGQEESEGHTHSENCYKTEKELVCEKKTEEVTEEHVHTEDCYEKTFVCEKTEHKHDKSCYSDKDADVETASDWEKDLPEELTGVWADDVLAVADSQLGYTESTKNYVVDEDGKIRGYSRYGDWYGDSYGHWCAMFVSFCLNYAEVDEAIMPYDASCQNWIETLSEEEYDLYREAGEYEPVPGDLIFFNWDSLPDSDHVGFVYEIIEATDDHGVQIKTIEGNASDTVKYRTYDIDDNSIMGYGQLPKNPEMEEETEVIEDTVKEQAEKTTQTIVFEDEDGWMKAEATFKVGVLPEDAILTVAFVEENVDELNETINDFVDEQNKELLNTFLFDVVFTDEEGNELEPDGDVKIKVSFDTPIEPISARVMRMSAEAEETPSAEWKLYLVDENNEVSETSEKSLETAANNAVGGIETTYRKNAVYALTTLALDDPMTVAEDTHPLPDPIPSNWAQAMYEIANSQLGYTTENTPKYGGWNYEFVEFCLKNAEVEPDVIRNDSNLEQWLAAAKEEGLYHDRKYQTNPGDIVFVRDESNALHVGVVHKVDGSEYNPNLYAIIGNKDTKCIEEYYIHDYYYNGDYKIEGFVSIPETMYLLKYEDDNLSAKLLSEDKFGNTRLEISIITDDDIARNVSNHLTTSDTNIYSSELIEVKLISTNAYGRETIQYPTSDMKLSVTFKNPIDSGSNQNTGAASWHLCNISSNKNIASCNAEFTITEEEDHLKNISFNGASVSTYVISSIHKQYVEVNSFNELQNLISSNNAVGIKLGSDFEANGTIQIPSGKKVKVDLNGHTISASTTLFAVDGGKLTLTDSQQNEEEIQSSGGDVVGNQAEYNSDTQTLTYYVTESTITNTDVGSTIETLTEHTVVLDGKIDGSGSYNPIITIASGTFEQRSGAIVGAKNRAISQSGGTLNLRGGYICGNTTSEGKDEGRKSGGAIFASGKSTINLSGTVLAANTVAERGGAISVESWEGATINITGGVISGNACTSNIDTGKNNKEIHVGGGGIFTKGKVAINMSGGYITNNISRATGYLDGGGGVFISKETVFTLNGGYITGNYAESGGGGIRSDFWEHYTTFNFNGGFVSSNKANLAEGGGVSINWGGVAYISGGYVTNNVTNTEQHWGGGGVFVSNGAKMYVIHALVTANHAGGFGGGLAGCSTGRVFLITDNGGAIYDNIANGETVTEGSEKAEDKIYGLYNPVFMKSGFNDYFCALTSTVEGNMLGGGPANWKGSADEVPITIGKDESHTASYIMGLTADPSQESINAAITEARVTNGIYIHNNNSNTHGGGVLCNGYLVVGNKDELENSTSLELTAKKTLLNEKEEVIPLGKKDEEGKLIEGTLKEFKFVIKDEADTVIATGKNDVDGNISFSSRIPFKKVGTYVYYIYEDVETNSEGYLMDTRKYKMTITVDVDASVMNQITLKQYKITHVKVEKNSNGEWELYSESDIGWDSKYEYEPVKMNLTGGTSFTNYEMNSGTTKVTATKKWTGTTPENTSIDVTLYQGDIEYSGSEATVTLNSSNNWTYTWTDLPRSDRNGEKYIYSVREKVPDGYTVSYETYNEVSTNRIWAPYTGEKLQEGMEYIIVSPDGTKALYLTSEHADKHLTSADKVDVVKESRPVTIDGKEYTDYYNVNTISERNIYRASSGNLNSGKYGTRMLNISTGSALLIQPENGLNLKDGTGVSDGWVSAFYLSDGMLVGYEKWDMSESTKKYIICYDSEAEKFEALPLNDENKSKAAKLYVQIQGTSLLDSETSVIITNTKNEDVEYGFKVTKVSDEYVGDEQDNHQNIPLAGAKFELRGVSDEALRFTRIADGAYEWYSGTLTDEAIESTTTELITNDRGKLAVSGLTEGTYTLVEVEAPNGYALAAPETVVLGADGNSSVVQLTIVDKKITEGSFILPETGGPGTNVYTAGGILLLMISVLLYIKKKNQKKGGQAFN